jgi:hypothetical protein
MKLENAAVRDPDGKTACTAFPIALHPARLQFRVPNDSGQVLALPPNRRAPFPAPRFRRRCPVHPSAPGTAGIARQATDGLRSSTKIVFRITRAAGVPAERRTVGSRTNAGRRRGDGVLCRPECNPPSPAFQRLWPAKRCAARLSIRRPPCGNAPAARSVWRHAPAASA